jgi:hypothetical protein
MLLLAIGPDSPLAGQENEPEKEAKRSAPKGSMGWTLDEAMAHQQLYPRDAYMQ